VIILHYKLTFFIVVLNINELSISLHKVCLLNLRLIINFHQCSCRFHSTAFLF